jgi:hypothetical protein
MATISIWEMAGKSKKGRGEERKEGDNDRHD